MTRERKKSHLLHAEVYKGEGLQFSYWQSEEGQEEGTVFAGELRNPYHPGEVGDLVVYEGNGEDYKSDLTFQLIPGLVLISLLKNPAVREHLEGCFTPKDFVGLPRKVTDRFSKEFQKEIERESNRLVLK